MNILYLADDLSADAIIIDVLKSVGNVEAKEIYDYKPDKFYDYIVLDFGGFSTWLGAGYTLIKNVIYRIKNEISKQCKVLYIISQVEKFLTEEEIEEIKNAGGILVDLMTAEVKNLFKEKQSEDR